jgi:hypothetical protein
MNRIFLLFGNIAIEFCILYLAVYSRHTLKKYGRKLALSHNKNPRL